MVKRKCNIWKERESKTKILRFEKLAKKNFNIQTRVFDTETWKQNIARDPTIPRSYSQLRRLGRIIFGKKGRRKWLEPERKSSFRGVVFPFFEECLESLYSNFMAGLANPFLISSQRSSIESDIDSDMPAFGHSKDTTHFTLHWTDNSTHADDNITDSSIIDDTGDYLETAWDKYNTVFGEQPYVPSGNTKIDVYFYDIGGYGATSPDGGIDLDSKNWVDKPGIRKTTSAHELFHRLQYTYGYRTSWTPQSPYKWFSEGTASWSEVFVWGRVSGAYKIRDLFIDPDMNLYDASYRALPFWLFFDTRQRDTLDDIPLVTFLQKYQTLGDEKQAAEDTIDEDWPSNNVYGQLDHFFALFSRERRIGSWRQTPTGGQPYAQILDPDDNDIVPVLTITDIALSLGDAYTNTETVSGLGSDYYRFVLGSNSDGSTFAVSVDGVAAGDFSYYMLWEKGGKWLRATFPFGVTEDYGISETINLNEADSVMMIISGRGTGGSYTINASIT